MRNIKLTIASLAVTAIVTGAAAQEPAEASTPAGIERKKMESLWFTHTDNAAGAQLDAMGRYSRLGIKYDKTKGGYKRAQEGVNNDSYGFSTDGGGTFDNLGGAFLWGYFDYTHDKIRDARFNASLIDPLRGMPYYIADRNLSDWINQDYSLGLKAATPALWDRLIFGIGLDYTNAQGAKQMDPRPKVLMSKFAVTPSVVVTAGRHAVGADFAYSSRREDGLSKNSVIFVNQPVWEMLGTGFFTDGEIGAGMSGLRDYNANSLGGGVQYSFSTDKIKVLLSGEYTHTVEDAGNHYTTPKTVGTTKENIWVGKLDLLWSLDDSNALSFDAEYYDRSLDGIEYVQIFDNTYEVSQWVVLSKNIRSNWSTRRAGFSLDYMNKDGGDAYRWLAGVDLRYEKFSDIYYIPRSTQNVDDIRIELRAKKNFRFGDNSILLGARGSYKNVLDSDRAYGGNNSSSEIYTEMVLHDYDYMRCDSWSLGGELTYTRHGIFNGRTSIFAKASADCLKACDSKIGRDLGRRGFLAVEVGLAF